MKYRIIFSTGYSDDSESLMKGYRSDILILDENENYYEINFVELEVIKSSFKKDKICFLENNMVILHAVTKENILKSITDLHTWEFYKRWFRLSKEKVEKYYYPSKEWITFEVIC